VLAVIACARVPPSERPAPAARPERWVDGSAPEGGDGSRERPQRALALAPGTVFHVATGLYELSGALPDGVELVGAKTVVLHAPEGLTATNARLQSVAIQGGQVGLTVQGSVTLRDVAFSGQRQVAVKVGPRAVLTVIGSEIVGSVPESRGIVSEGRLQLAATAFKGALRRGVHVLGGEAVIEDLTSVGAAEAVHVASGLARVERASVSGGRGPAFFVAAGRLELREVKVTGHEYAVQTAIGAQLDVNGLVSERAAIAAVAVVGAKANLEHLTISRHGSHGALELLDADVRATDVTVSEGADYAVLIRKGKAELKQLKARFIHDGDGSGGDGVLVRDAEARLEDLDLSDLGGAGVVASALASVDIVGLRCERCRIGALLVERRATVRAKGIVSIGAREAAVSLPDDGVLELDGLEVEGSSQAVWAECAPGSRVVLRGKLPARELLSGRCLEFPRPAAREPSDSGR